jgi:hypothetical protein
MLTYVLLYQLGEMPQPGDSWEERCVEDCGGCVKNREERRQVLWAFHALLDATGTLVFDAFLASSEGDDMRTQAPLVCGTCPLRAFFLGFSHVAETVVV